MTHHQTYDTYILRIANQPSGLLTESSNGFFKAKIPGHLRDRQCFIHVMSGTVGNLSGLFPSPSQVDTNRLLLKHNITTVSYDITSRGTDQTFGIVIRPDLDEKIGKLNEDAMKDLGLCLLPPEIEVETVGILTASGLETRLTGAAGFVEVIMRLDFPKRH